MDFYEADIGTMNLYGYYDSAMTSMGIFNYYGQNSGFADEPYHGVSSGEPDKVKTHFATEELRL